MVAIAALLLLLNIVAPTTGDVRVVKYVVPVVSQVRGRVINVPVENNRPVKKGDVLFSIDPTPYQNEVHSLEARLTADQAKVGADRERLSEAQAKLTDAQSSEPQLTRTVERGHRADRHADRLAGAGAQARSPRTPSSWPPAPATGSISSRRRPASAS